MRKLIGVKEAAQYTGLSVYTVYTMVSQRRIPYVKVGRLVKFDVPMLDAWIKSNTENGWLKARHDFWFTNRSWAEQVTN